VEKPLAGIKVLDLTQFLAGPFCTMVLADMGADVIKIEPPGGEPQRNAMRPKPDQEGLSFLTLNRNKRAIVLNLREPEGRELFLELARTADVVVENFKPGTTTKLGIDYETLRELRPELIYATITGFGDAGPWAERPGLDAIAQAMSGLMSITGYPGMDPVQVGVPATDLTAGLFCTIGIVSAYVQRMTTGEGQRVETSLFQAGLAYGIHESSQYWESGRVPEPLGSGHRFAAPYQALRTKDGYVTVGAGTEKLWERFCGAIGRMDLFDHPQFARNADRMQNLTELVAELERTLATDTSEAWTDKIIEAGVPAGPILDYADVLEHEHTHAVGMVVEYEHPRQGRLKTLGVPVKLSAAPQNGVTPAPLLAQHTEEVLADIGIDADRIAELREKGVV
jgi:crotonobetainyl-CoA:carnitine CoA-transferase CaiB-like acyl-CoA transferase